MWEERFRRLKEWKKTHGHCAVPIAQGELGTWVSKQRQLRKRGKLSKEKVEALDSLQFTWSTAEADWEDKFKRLCEWTRERGHASVPFNEGELGWWVNTQRQCKRKGKLSAIREARLQSLGFVWNPSNSRSRTSPNATMTTTTGITGMTSLTPTTTTALGILGLGGLMGSTASSSTDTTPTWTPEKGLERELSEEETNNAILQMFGGHGHLVGEGSPVTAEFGFEGGAGLRGKEELEQHRSTLGLKQEDSAAVVLEALETLDAVSTGEVSIHGGASQSASQTGGSQMDGCSMDANEDADEGMEANGMSDYVSSVGVSTMGVGNCRMGGVGNVDEAVASVTGHEGELLDQLWSPTILSSPLMNAVGLGEMGTQGMESGDESGSGGSMDLMAPALHFF